MAVRQASQLALRVLLLLLRWLAALPAYCSSRGCQLKRVRLRRGGEGSADSPTGSSEVVAEEGGVAGYEMSAGRILTPVTPIPSGDAGPEQLADFAQYH